MIDRKQANPEIRATMVELARKNNLHYFNLTDGVNMREAWLIGLSIGIFIAAAAAGFGGGWLVAMILEQPEKSLAISLLGSGGTAVLVGMFELDWILTAGRANYEAEMGLDTAAAGRSFPQAADNPRRRIVLTENDKRMLPVFARRYPMIRTLAVNDWEGETSPLVFDFISKRDAIKRIQHIVVNLGYGTRDGRGGVRVSGDFDGRVIPNWQNGIFEVENDG